MPRYHGAIVSVSLLALALAGCSKSAQDMTATTADAGLPPLPAALPMQTGPASPLVAAPPISALPVRRYVGLSRPLPLRESYAYLDRASDVQDEIGDAPPDYDYVDDDGVRPWAWETRSGDYRYAEPADDGYRDYYYERGAEYPYLVRTHDYSYAYAGGALVAIYLLNGALVPPDQYGGYRDQASRYFWRGEQLRRAAEQRPHQGVYAANWAAQRQRFNAQQARWMADRSRQPEWQAYHAQNDPSQRPGWQQEYQQRQQVARQFANWQTHGLIGTPPPALAIAGPRAGAPGAPRLAGPVQPQRAPAPLAAQPHAFPPAASAFPNGNAQAAAARAQQLATQRQAQQQALASQQQVLTGQRLAQEATRAQQAAAAQRQAAAERQQYAARNTAQQQAAAAREQRTAQLAAQQQQLTNQRADQVASRTRQLAAAQQQAAAGEQQRAARLAAQQQLASQRAEQMASQERERAAAQQQAAAAREQQMAARQAAQQAAAQRSEAANAERRQAGLAQQQMAAQRQAQQREAAAGEAQARALAAQRQAESARARAPHPQLGHEIPRQPQ